MTDQDRIAALEQKVADLEANTTRRSQILEGNPYIPPLDAKVMWAKEMPASNPTSQVDVGEILALVSDNHAKGSYAWPLLVFLKTTDHPQADGNSSQSTGTNVMMFCNGPGTTWAAGSHVEVHHGDAYGPDKSNLTHPGTTIGFNMELTRRSPQGNVIGVEVANVGTDKPGEPALPGNAAINIMGKWKIGIRGEGDEYGHPDPTEDSLRGDTFLAVHGHWGLGADFGPNDIQIRSGHKLFLDDNKRVYLTYNPEGQKVELWKGGKCVQKW